MVYKALGRKVRTNYEQKFNLTEVTLDFAKNTYEIKTFMTYNIVKNFMTYNIVIFIKTAN